jgi:hypothetical protein
MKTFKFKTVFDSTKSQPLDSVCNFCKDVDITHSHFYRCHLLRCPEVVSLVNIVRTAVYALTYLHTALLLNWARNTNSTKYLHTMSCLTSYRCCCSRVGCIRFRKNTKCLFRHLTPRSSENIIYLEITWGERKAQNFDPSTTNSFVLHIARNKFHLFICLLTYFFVWNSMKT